MEILHRHKLILLSSIISLSTSCLANNHQENSDSFLIFGALSKNEYSGSKDHDVVPAIISEFTLFKRPVEIEGLTTRASLYSSNAWHFGLAIQYDFGRDDEVSNKQVAAIKTIDANINLGGYISHFSESILLNKDELELRVQTTADVSSTHEGYLTTFSSTYTFPLFIPWRVELELESSYADDNYMNTYYGVSAQDAQSSGLRPFQANSGFTDITVNANIILFSSPQWGAYSRLSYARLLGDAADSPIVKDIGTANQTQFGLGLFYRF